MNNHIKYCITGRTSNYNAMLLGKALNMERVLTLGWNTIAVTKSICWKQHKHSVLEMCHNLEIYTDYQK
jgi:hypothetical protein